MTNLMNYGTNKISGEWGRTLSLGVAGIPAAAMPVGTVFLPETSNSILDRVKSILQKIHGTDDVHDELQDLINARKAAKKVTKSMEKYHSTKIQASTCNVLPYTVLPATHWYKHHHVSCFCSVQKPGLGFGNDSLLMSAVVTGVVNVVGTIVSMVTVDKLGRRILLLEGGLQMSFARLLLDP